MKHLPETFIKSGIGLAAFLLMLFVDAVTALSASSPWYDAAKKEGEIIIYTSISVDEHPKMVDPFSRKYPGINVKFIRQSSNSVLQRVLNEGRAGKSLADIVAVGAEYLNVIEEKGLLQGFKSAESNAKPDGQWYQIYLSDHGIGYNTNLVSRKDAPVRYKDLLHKRWAGGHIAINMGNPTWIYTMLDFFGEEQGMKFLKDFAAIGPRAERGTTRIMQSLSAGEMNAAVALNANRVIQTKEKGAPVDLAPIKDAVYADVHGIGVHAQSRHPNAARLFIDFLVSKQGQQIMATDLSKIPADPDVVFKAYDVDRKNLRLIGRNALAKINDYEKMMQKLFTK